MMFYVENLHTKERGEDCGRRGSGARGRTPGGSPVPGGRPRGRRPLAASAGPRGDTFSGLLAFKSRFFAAATVAGASPAAAAADASLTEGEEVGESGGGGGGNDLEERTAAVGRLARARWRWPRQSVPGPTDGGGGE